MALAAAGGAIAAARGHGARAGLEAPAAAGAPPLARAAAARGPGFGSPPAPRADLAARLEAAGLDTPPGDVMAAKTGAALIALSPTLPLAATLAPLTPPPPSSPRIS